MKLKNILRSFAAALTLATAAHASAAVTPKNGATVDLLTADQKTFVSKTTSARATWLNSLITSDPDRAMKIPDPSPLVISWDGDSSSCSVTVTETATGKVYLQTTAKSPVNCYNLRIGYDYQLKIKGSSIDSTTTFKTSATAPRLMWGNKTWAGDGEGVSNFRDLGGYTGLNGKRVRQGLIYRSAALNAKKGGASYIKEDARAILVDQLGIKTDIDLREAGENTSTTASPIGSGVAYYNFPSTAYSLKASATASYMQAARVMFDKNNLPAVFHCQGGRDRGGTMPVPILALLGVSEDDIYLDYMLTTTSLNMPPWDDPGKFKNTLNAIKEFSGSTLAEQAANFFIKAGFTTAEITAFRAMMLEDGTEEEATSHTHSWSDWTVTKAATCTEAGSRTRTCSAADCPYGGTQTETIEALGHDWGAWTTIREKTEELSGLEQRTCSRCKATEQRETGRIVPTELPSAYTACTWVGSTADGKQWFDTKLAAADFTHVDIDFELSALGGDDVSALVGARWVDTSDKTTNNQIIVAVNASAAWFGGQGTYSAGGPAEKAFEGLDAVKTATRYSLKNRADGSHIHLGYGSTTNDLKLKNGHYEGAATLGVLAMNDTSANKAWRHAPAKIYSLQIYSGRWTSEKAAELVRNYIPCQRTADGVYGFYDMITGDFAVSASSDDFVGEGGSATTHTHVWSDWVVTTEANCAEAGEKTRTCSADGCTVVTQTETIPATGEHDYYWVTDKAATETETGLRHQQCKVCEGWGVEEVIPATGGGDEPAHTHAYGDWIIDQAPTETTAGSKHRVCDCGDIEYAVIPATGSSTAYTKVGTDVWDGACSFAGSASSAVGWQAPGASAVEAGHAVAAANDYVIPSGASLVTHQANATETFAGKSLTVAEGGVFQMTAMGVADKTQTTTVDDLIVANGTVNPMGRANVLTLAGQLTVADGNAATILLDSYAKDATTFSFTLASKLVGAGTVNVELKNTSKPSSAYGTDTFVLSGDASGFTGVLAATGTYLPTAYNLYITGAFGGSVASVHKAATTAVKVNYAGLVGGKGLKVATTAVPDALKTCLTFYGATDFTAANLRLLTFPSGTAVTPADFAIGHAATLDGEATAFTGLAAVGNADGTVSLVANANGETPTEPEHTHAWGDWVTNKVAEVGVAGERQRTCACGEVETEVIPALEPDPEDPVDPTPVAGDDWGWSNRVTIAGTDCCVLAFTNTAAAGFAWTVPSGVTAIDYLVVGGGSGGAQSESDGTRATHGGNAGAFVESTASVTAGTTLQVVVGAGGAASEAGGASSLGAIATAAGGAAVDGMASAGSSVGGNGGNGAGGDGEVVTGKTGGAGGAGKVSSITGVETWYAAGGGGGKDGVGGSGIGGNGGAGGGSSGTGESGTPGLAGTGSGGGGAGRYCPKDGNLGAGGSGIVIVRYAVAGGEPPAGEDKPTVDGNDVEPEKVLEAANSEQPIVYPTEPEVTGEVGAQQIVFGSTTVDVPPYYTATKTGNTVSLALNANAVPAIASDAAGEKKAFEVTDDAVSLHLENVHAALYYTLQKATALGASADWTAVETKQGAADFTAERTGGDGYYRILVTDVMPK